LNLDKDTPVFINGAPWIGFFCLKTTMHPLIQNCVVVTGARIALLIDFRIIGKIRMITVILLPVTSLVWFTWRMAFAVPLYNILSKANLGAAAAVSA
jgi:hypothetical protein